jgi:hypothetical protein
LCHSERSEESRFASAGSSHTPWLGVRRRASRKIEILSCAQKDTKIKTSESAQLLNPLNSQKNPVPLSAREGVRG